MIRKATKNETDDWDDFIKSGIGGGHIQQSRVWSELKKKYDWEALFLVFEYNNDLYPFLALKKKSRIIKNHYMIARGPGFYDYVGQENFKRNALKAFSKQIRDYLTGIDKDAAVLQFQPWIESKEVDLNQYGFIPYSLKDETNSTIFVNISEKEDAILAKMKKKTRYSIKSSAKSGVVVTNKQPTKENLQVMYNLMLATQQRAGFFLRRKDYFFAYWLKMINSGSGALFLAEYNDTIVAGAFVTVFGQHAIYKDGGSLSEYKNLSAPYLLQWEAMKWAKSKGASDYDMGGVPPSTKLDSSHKYFGMYSFKKKFNSEVTDFVPTHEMILNPSKYRLYKRYWKYYNSAYIRLKKNIFF